MKKIVRELRKEFPEASIEVTRGGHIRIRFVGRTPVFTAATPGDWRSMYNVRAEVRRATRKSR